MTIHEPSAAAARALPAFYDAAADLIGRNLPARAAKTAFVDEQGAYTYAEFAARVGCPAGAQRTLGLESEQRVALGLLDTRDVPTAFLGAIKADIVPIPVNMLFQRLAYAFILADSRAKASIISAELFPQYDSTLAVEAAPTRPDDVCFRLCSSGPALDRVRARFPEDGYRQDPTPCPVCPRSDVSWWHR